jgi:hypothetical protein
MNEVRGIPSSRAKDGDDYGLLVGLVLRKEIGLDLARTVLDLEF